MICYAMTSMLCYDMICYAIQYQCQCLYLYLCLYLHLYL